VIIARKLSYKVQIYQRILQFYLIKEYFQFLKRLYDITFLGGSLRLINRGAVYEKRQLFQIRLYVYNLLRKFKHSL
jgi:hypothetical protein